MKSVPYESLKERIEKAKQYCQDKEEEEKNRNKVRVRVLIDNTQTEMDQLVQGFIE